MAVWFITGCSSGLGHGIAQRALEAGETVIMTARNTAQLRALSGAYPDTSLAVYLELGDPESMKSALEQGRRRFGQIDILVNNAGHGYRAAVEESEASDIQKVFEHTFFAPAQLMRMVLPEMRRRQRGVLVNISSIGAVRGALGNGYYSAAKGALELLTESLSKEVYSFGIQTMLVEPGAFQTEFYGRNLEESSTKLADYDCMAERYRKAFVDPSAAKPGDPQTGGRIIVDVILKGVLPERLLLGSDAVSAAETTYLNRLKELYVWETVSRSSDFSKIPPAPQHPQIL